MPTAELRGRTIVALNHPVLRDVIPSYYAQIEKAVGRGDLVSVNHRLAALLASYFDTVFAVNLSLRGAAARLETALAAAGVDHGVKEYPDAGHAFLNDHSDDDVPKLFLLMGAVTRTGYHEPSAIDARRRIVAFFNKHLKAD